MRRGKNIKHGVSSYKVGVNLVSVALVVCERGQRTRELAISTPVCFNAVVILWRDDKIWYLTGKLQIAPIRHIKKLKVL